MAKKPLHMERARALCGKDRRQGPPERMEVENLARVVRNRSPAVDGLNAGRREVAVEPLHGRDVADDAIGRLGPPLREPTNDFDRRIGERDLVRPLGLLDFGTDSHERPLVVEVNVAPAEPGELRSPEPGEEGEPVDVCTVAAGGRCE